MRDRIEWHEYLQRAVGLLTTSPRVLDERAFRGQADVNDDVTVERNPWCLWKWRDAEEDPEAPPFEEPLAFLCGPPAMTDEMESILTMIDETEGPYVMGDTIEMSEKNVRLERWW